MTKHFTAAFAMSFTHEEVVLEKRDGEGWRKLGAVRFALGDMGRQLCQMRDPGDAAGPDLGAEAVPDTLLVIPDDQILYTTLSVPPGPEPALAVARALEGLTPYQVKDLAFDWSPSIDGQSDSLRVAAVARRTLEEAEAFALEQGFQATGFIARPGDERFAGQPNFGPSNLVRNLARRSTVTEPGLRRAGITSAGIADLPSDPQPGPIISAVVPHVYADAPVVPQTPVADVVADATDAPAVAVQPAGQTDDPDAPVAADRAVAGTPRRETALAPRVEPAVIRHGAVRPGPVAQPAVSGKALPPRAQAVHARAAEARAARAGAPTALPTQVMPQLLARARALGKRPPSTFAVMMGLLVLALTATLFLFGGGETTDQAPAVAAVDQPADGAVIEDTTEPIDTAEAVETGLPTDAELDALAAADTATPTAPVAEAEAPAPVVAEAPAESAVEAPAAAANLDEDVLAALREAQTEAATTVAATAAAPATPPAEPVTQAAAEPVAEPAAAPERAEPASPDPEAAVAATKPAVTAAAPLRSLALSRSTRPASAPSRTAQPESTDAAPSLPADPLPFKQRAEPAPVRVTGLRPPSRPSRAAASAPAPAPTPASAAAPTAAPAAAPAPEARPAPASTPAALPNSGRPPSRPDSLTLNLLPEGSDVDETRHARLQPQEIEFLEQLLRDLRTAQVGKHRLSRAEHDALIILAQARPQRRPVDVSGGTQRAVENALAAAVASTPPPSSRPKAESTASQTTAETAPSPRASGGLSRSGRPQSRPRALAARAGSAGGNASLSNSDVEDAIKAAVATGPLAPGAVALTALSSSPLPPRRSARAAAAAAAAAAPTAAAPVAALAPSPQASASEEAAIAQQRRQDAELQAQAEARARARASADAQAEAQARAAAEARARAQAQAEAQAAAARNQAYTPPEAEKEPEVQTNIPTGATAASVAAAATVKDGIRLGSTQIISTIGAGKASRALVRLSNGKIITLRLGDKINGGTITEIGNSRITYVKGGRTSALGVLDGR